MRQSTAVATVSGVLNEPSIINHLVIHQRGLPKAAKDMANKTKSKNGNDVIDEMGRATGLKADSKTPSSLPPSSSSSLPSTSSSLHSPDAPVSTERSRYARRKRKRVDYAKLR